MEFPIYSTTYNNEKSYWWYVARLHILEKMFLKFVVQKQNLRILNIGCGTGAISERFSKYGAVVNLDINLEALRLCKLRNLINADAMKLPFRCNSFNLIIACDLLEHSDNDINACKEIERCLQREGKFIITIPAYKFMWSKMDNKALHKRRYTKKSLQEIAKKIKLKITKISYFNTLLFHIAIIERAYKSLFGKHISGESFLPKANPTINRLFRFVFSREAFLLRYFDLPFGLSIILIDKNKK